MIVIDTNVLVVANGKSAVSEMCQLEAISALLACDSSSEVVIDSDWEILTEYGKHCSFEGQPGVGDQFYRWLVDNLGSTTVATLTADGDRRFVEFPEDPDLADFDWDDRVFVACALVASPCQILNAVDSDYRNAQVALQRVGADVVELCESELKAP